MISLSDEWSDVNRLSSRADRRWIVTWTPDGSSLTGGRGVQSDDRPDGVSNGSLSSRKGLFRGCCSVCRMTKESAVEGFVDLSVATTITYVSETPLCFHKKRGNWNDLNMLLFGRERKERTDSLFFFTRSSSSPLFRTEG